ncbi:MAG: excinuclease ABC subunit UvrC [Gammaproteobacteria bacterium]
MPAIFDIRAALDNLPAAPGVYRFFDGGGRALYVGKAQNIKSRVAAHFRAKQTPRMQVMTGATRSVEITVASSANEALVLENDFIKSLKPKYNIVFRDDKTYPLLRLSRHPYPRVMLYRAPVRGGGDDGEDCFGPFPDSRAVRASIDLIQRLFGLRSCADSVFANRSRPCLLHGIGRCTAPCVNKITPPQYAADTSAARAFLSGGADAVTGGLQKQMEDAAARLDYEKAATLRDRLRALAAVREKHFAADNSRPDADYVGAAAAAGCACVNVVAVRGGRRIGESRFFPKAFAAGGSEDESALLAAFVCQHYGKGGKSPPPSVIFIHKYAAECANAAPFLAKHISTRPPPAVCERLRQAADNAACALALRRAQNSGQKQKLAALAKHLQMPPPVRMECFDISHTAGGEVMAARAVFVDGAAQTSQYRKYKIAVDANNDYAAMREAVGRSLRRAIAEGAPLPDLLIADGGAGQLQATLLAMADAGLHISAKNAPVVIAIAKGKVRSGDETIIMADGETAKWQPSDPALHLLQAIRDEAHRFAIAGHRKLRDKKSGSSVLDAVAGVGRQKRKRLMARFGGLAGLAGATAAELTEIDGIGAELAGRLHRALRQ